MRQLNEAADRDRVVLRLYEQLLEIEQRLIPTGMHVFGSPPDGGQLSDMLRMVASFDRPEIGARSLPDLIAAGLHLPDYRQLVKESGASEERLVARERVESLLRRAVAVLLEPAQADEDTSLLAAAFLEEHAHVPASQSESMLRLLLRIHSQLSVDQELDSLTRALRGEYIEPGPGADIVQNPDILPTGRNTHAVNPYGVPSPGAFRRSEQVAAALVERAFAEQGRYPEAIGMVLWGMDNIKTQGEGVAQALWLMGVEPRRDSMNRVSDVAVIPLERLGRPRIDVVMTVSGIFRDLFGATMELLDKAVRTVGALDEPLEMNFVRKHVLESVSEGLPLDDALIRVFSNAAGNYGTNVNFMVIGSQWDQPDEIGDLFVTRKCFAYRRGVEGRQAQELMNRALERVAVTYQNIDNTEIGITDVDHYFEYLGGLSRAVAKRSGVPPKAYLSDSIAPLTKVRSLEETIRLETRTKVLNPKWYEGMLRHGFSGVAEIEHHVTNTFGWSATADAVDGWIYDEIAGTYVMDEAMLARLRTLNPHATRSLALRLLEAGGRGYWQSDERITDRLHEIVADVENEFEGLGPATASGAAS